MLVVNFKHYVAGEKTLELAKKIQKHFPRAIVAVPPVDLATAAHKTKLRVYAQHVDSLAGDRATGHVLVESVKAAGGKGSLLNHSEHRLSRKEIVKTLVHAKRVGLRIILCVASVREARRYKELTPYAIAYEDPKLVSSGKSITLYRANEVERFARELEDSTILPLCGAGIHSKEDLRAARKLGCKGVLLASAIAAVRKPEKLLKELRNA